MKPLRIGVMGIDHGHIYGQIAGMRAAGAELVAWWTSERTDPVDIANFTAKHPEIPQVKDAAQILEDDSLSLILISAIPEQRAGFAISAMQHGKDVMVDKPGATTLDQLARVKAVQAETGRIWSVCFSERLAVEATTLVDKIIAEGRIGKVLQTVGLGPHKLGNGHRAEWFFSRQATGGILCDIAAHQFDQFLHYTGSTSARVVSAHVGNMATPQHAELQDFGEVMLAGDQGRGYARVDWLTPKGLPVWGDGRITILGSEGYIELRKYIDIAGREGTEHVFLADARGVEYLSAKGQGTPYFGCLAADIESRGETAMTQRHAFLATELALTAQAMAEASLAETSRAGEGQK